MGSVKDFEIREDGVLKEYTGNGGDVVIPDGVTVIEWNVFNRCTSLTSVIIPDSVTEIKMYAFKNCTSLTAITIPDSVTEIGKSAFKGCIGLADKNGFVIVKGILYDYVGEDEIVSIPDGVTQIEEAVFSGCTGITSITIPDSVTEIGEKAFEDCIGLSSIDIPDSVKEIADYAFYGCKELTKVTIPTSVIEIGDFAFLDCPKHFIDAPKGSYAAGHDKRILESRGIILRPEKVLRLLQRYLYDKSEKHDRDDNAGTWSASEEVSALDVYDYNGTPYIVLVSWYYNGSGDMADSDHDRSLSFKVYPIDSADVDNEEKVREIVANTKGYENHVGDYPNVNIRDEESFSSCIRPYVIGAINAYNAYEKKKRAEQSGNQSLPNVVKVYKDNRVMAEVVYDFDTDAGLGSVFYNCTSVRMKPLHEQYLKDLGINRQLGFYYCEGRGKPTVSTWIDQDSNHRRICVHFGNWWDTGNSAVICAYENGEPGPLTPDEVQKILDFPTKD